MVQRTIVKVPILMLCSKMLPSFKLVFEHLWAMGPCPVAPHPLSRASPKIIAVYNLHMPLTQPDPQVLAHSVIGFPSNLSFQSDPVGLTFATFAGVGPVDVPSAAVVVVVVDFLLRTTGSFKTLYPQERGVVPQQMCHQLLIEI